MSDIYFKCECGKSLAVDEAGIGRVVSCVDCGKPVLVPDPELEFDCEGCGEILLAPASISGDRIKCAACGHRQAVPSLICSSGGGATSGRAVFRGVGGSAPSGNSLENSIPPSPIVSTAPSLVMASLLRRRSEFTIRRRPPRRSLRERIGPRLQHWLLCAAAAFAVLVLARELMRDVFRSDAPEIEQHVSNIEKPSEQQLHYPPELSVSRPAAADTPDAEQRAIPDMKAAGPEMAAAVAGVAEGTTNLPGAPAQPEDGLAAAPSEVGVQQTGERMAAAAPEKKEPEKKIQFGDRIAAVGALIKPDRSEFNAAVPKLWREMLDYTRSHSGVALDDTDWFFAFRTAGEWMLSSGPMTHARSLAVVNEGLDVLSEASPADERLCVRLATDLAMTHAERWMSTHVRECAGLVDGVWEWAVSFNDPALKNACFGRMLFVEGNLLINRFGVPDGEQDGFIEERESKLWKCLDDEELALDDRTTALSHWTLALHGVGREKWAVSALAAWQQRYGADVFGARYCSALLEISLFGLGDWRTAGFALNAAALRRTTWRSSHDDALFAEMCRIYYDNMLCNDYELVRVGYARRKELDEKLRPPSGGPGRGRES